MKNLVGIEAEIYLAKNENDSKIARLKKEALELFEAELKSNNKKDLYLKGLIVAVENSKHLTSIEHDEWYCQYVLADFSKLIDTKNELQKELLETYLQENHCINADFKNGCLTYSIGPAILINDDGDVLDQDSRKWILSKKDYNDDSERDEAIELYMDKHGYFPAVIEVDRHGNASYTEKFYGSK